MRSLLADIFRFLFRFPFFRKKFYGLHRRIFFPYRLFRGVRKSFVFRNSIRFELAIDDWIPENLFFLNEYEPAEIRLLETFIHLGAVVIDIGANIGLYTLSAAHLAGTTGQVIAFEPFSENFRALEKNLSLNPFKNVRLEKLALSDRATSLSLRYEPKEANKGMVSAYAAQGNQTEIAAATSLDHYLEAHPVHRLDFIKIDIEGGEYPALLGMRKTLEKFSPALLVEINFGILSLTPYSAQQIIQYLQELGYREFQQQRPPNANRIFTKGGN